MSSIRQQEMTHLHGNGDVAHVKPHRLPIHAEFIFKERPDVSHCGSQQVCPAVLESYIQEARRLGQASRRARFCPHAQCGSAPPPFGSLQRLNWSCRTKAGRSRWLSKPNVSFFWRFYVNTHRWILSKIYFQYLLLRFKIYKI